MGPHAPKDVHEISGYFGLSLGSDKTLGNRWATQGQYFRLFLGFMVTIFWATWLLHADTTLGYLGIRLHGDSYCTSGYYRTTCRQYFGLSGATWDSNLGYLDIIL